MKKSWTMMIATMLAALAVLAPRPVTAQYAPFAPGFQPNYALKVWISSTLETKTDAGKELVALHERVKDFMNKSKLGVPDDRLQYFLPRWVNNPPIVGWSGMIQSVQPIKGGGYAVTLRVQAVEDSGGFDSLYLHEHYTVIAGKVRYQGFTLPPPGTWRVKGG